MVHVGECHERWGRVEQRRDAEETAIARVVVLSCWNQEAEEEGEEV